MKRLAVLLPALLLVPRVTAQPAELTYERHVRPILKANCFECHGENAKPKASLDLRLRRLIVQGGSSGPAIKPGTSKDSLLIARVAAGEMPPGKKKLTAAEIDTLRRWIDAGARTSIPEPDRIATGFHISPQERAFWAFQPVRRPAVPGVRSQRSEVRGQKSEVRGQRSEVRNAIDAFIFDRLEKEGITAGSEADRGTLLRRVTFDLTGLPPTPDEVDAARNDNQADWYERVVERLLDSPAYGERWGRHWLDVAGYADSDGYTSEDRVRPHAWRYRDYVIHSFNADRPFDRFIVEQLAGDELVKPPYRDLKPDDVEKLTATGFLRMAPDGTGLRGVDEPLARNQVIADTLRIVSTSLMGLTVGCAQCHHQRYDPISQDDYYRLRALFEPAYDPKDWKTPAGRAVSLYTDADRKEAERIEAEAKAVDAERLKKQEEFIERTFQKELAKLPDAEREPVRLARTTAEVKRTPQQRELMKRYPSVNVSAGSLYLYDKKAADELKGYADRAARLRSTKPVEEFVHALTEVPGKLPPTFLFHRGDHAQPGPQVQPGGLSVLDDVLPLTITPDPNRTTSGRRLALARWLTDRRHPLTARAIVNRVWMHHFGRGLVGTPADLGSLGERPTHPELLDWLADDFMANGWSMKRLHRLIVTSTTYRQSSRRDPVNDRIDPDNRLLTRMSVRRLEAEAIRDSILAVSGSLNRKPFGKPIPVTTDEVGQVVIGFDNKDTAGYIVRNDKLAEGEERRRTLYVQIRRSQPLTVTEPFDAPLVEPNCECRKASTVAPQSLVLMNNTFVLAQAEAFARRVSIETEPASQVRRAWQLAFGRDPEPKELTAALAFLKARETAFAKSPKFDAKKQALAGLCHALLSSSEFLYVD